MGALECNINMLLISLMDDTQPYRAEVRDRSVHSNFSYLHRSITVNLMMFLLTIYQTYSKADFPALFSLEAPLEEEPASATFSHLCDSSGRLAFQQLLIIQTLVSLINFLRSKGLVSSIGRHKMP